MGERVGKREGLSGSVGLCGAQRLIHQWTVRTALLAALLASGCSPSQHASEPEATLALTPTVSAEEREAERVAEDEVAIVDVYHRYWDAVAAVQAGNVDPALFDGIATAAVAEQELAVGRNYQGWGIAVEGEPISSRVDVELEGDTATVWACLDHSARVVVHGDDVTFPDDPMPDDPMPGGFKFQRVGGSWLAAGDPGIEPDFTC